MVHFGGHWSEWLLAGAIGGLYLCSLLTGIETLATLAGALFWLSLPTLLFGRRVKVDGKRLVLEIGWPVTLFRVEIAPEEIIEVVDLERAEGVLPLRYSKPAIPLTLLWIGVGTLGFIIDPRWSFVWFGWVYWGLMTLLPFLFPKKAKRWCVLTIFALGIIMSGLARWVGVEDYPLYVLVTIVIGFFYLTDFRERTVVIVTETGTYFVSSLNESEIREFMESLKMLVSGGSNVPAP
ncbi:hypothetical protein [Thermococcus sp. 9N3]|uniref:hypothetical protein n=1 Tax=Thermococcus sp. 9N3 TaxID=163002 RepID=UPI001431FE60|nr:hypothetical protein [Thermococcus sp. 9N3]NJE49323.1 hypothetical protein [Thermococcus sp. 9N3]